MFVSFLHWKSLLKLLLLCTFIAIFRPMARTAYSTWELVVSLLCIFFFRYWNVWTWVCLEEEKREDGSKNGNKMACGGWHVLCVLHFLLILTTFHETSKDLLHLQIAKPNSPWTLLPLGCSRLSSLNTHRKPFLTVSVSSLPMQREECTAECVCTIPH